MNPQDRLKKVSELTAKMTEITVEIRKLTHVPNNVTVSYILNLVTRVFDANPLQVNPKTGRVSHNKDITEARYVSRVLLNDYTDLTQEQIAKETGGKDHSVITQAVKAVKDRLDTDVDFKWKYNKCIDEIFLLV